MTNYLKDPASAVDYSVDWGAGYLDAQTVAASGWSVAPVHDGGIVVAAEALAGRRTAATLEGGLPGRVYRVANHVTLSDGRTDTRALTIRIEAR